MTLGTLYTMLTARPVKGIVPFGVFVIACYSEYLGWKVVLHNHITPPAPLPLHSFPEGKIHHGT